MVNNDILFDTTEIPLAVGKSENVLNLYQL